MQKNKSYSPNIKIGGNVTTQQGNSNIGNEFADNADLSYSITTTSTPQLENISHSPSEVNQNQQIDQEEKGISTEEVRNSRPAWKERKDYQLAAATLVVTALTGIVVPIVLKVTGKV